MPQLRTYQSNSNGYSGASPFLGPATGKIYSNGRSQIPDANGTPKDSGRPRRMTTPNTGASDDLFLTLANDDESLATAGSNARGSGWMRKV